MLLCVLKNIPRLKQELIKPNRGNILFVFAKSKVDFFHLRVGVGSFKDVDSAAPPFTLALSVLQVAG